jgi:hypothetical protein
MLFLRLPRAPWSPLGNLSDRVDKYVRFKYQLLIDVNWSTDLDTAVEFHDIGIQHADAAG